MNFKRIVPFIGLLTLLFCMTVSCVTGIVSSDESKDTSETVSTDELVDTGAPEVDDTAKLVDTDALAAMGCSPANTPVCSNLGSAPLGDCGENLGWYYDGNKCQEAIGCIGETEGYCFYQEAADCARGCSAEDRCHWRSFVGMSWPRSREYMQCLEAYICAETDKVGELFTLYEDMPTTVTYDYCDRTIGVDDGLKIPSLFQMKEDMWEQFCAMSLMPTKVEIICALMKAGF